MTDEQKIKLADYVIARRETIEDVFEEAHSSYTENKAEWEAEEALSTLLGLRKFLNV